MNEQEALEELASWLNTTDDSRSLGWVVKKDLGDKLFIKGDGVNYTKDEAIVELDKRARIVMSQALGVFEILAKVRKESKPYGQN